MFMPLFATVHFSGALSCKNQGKMDADRLKETRRQIESNDPDLTNLTINTYSDKYNYLPHDGDWERDGNAIGGNVHINELCFAFNLGTVVARDKFESFCRGLANNESIEKLGIGCCALFGGEIFTMLCPFFEKNCNLYCYKGRE